MACLQAADILLPAEGVELKKWAVIACDQFTSRPEYWKQAAVCVGEAPSTLHMIYPEVYLQADDEQAYQKRIRGIQRYMEQCLEREVLEERVHKGYILTARETEAGIRTGLIAALDLEAYDYAGETKARVRATEATVESRIPVRVGIRQGAPLELPHVMMLLDDRKRCLLEQLYKQRDHFVKLYDTELMMGGGRVAGYAVEGAAAETLTAVLERMEQESGELFLAVGDGNHSLAAARACWEKVKESLPEADRGSHPARYALVEVVNIHSPALIFHPIHRVLFGVRMESVAEEFRKYLKEQDICRNELSKEEGADVVFFQGENYINMKLPDTRGRLPVEILQGFLDKYLRDHLQCRIDYVHGRQAAKSLAKEQQACAVLLGAVDKNKLFSAISAGGVLPRKTFSIGEDRQKRYYMECRSLRQIKKQ